MVILPCKDRFGLFSNYTNNSSWNPWAIIATSTAKLSTKASRFLEIKALLNNILTFNSLEKESSISAPRSSKSSLIALANPCLSNQK